MKSFSPEDLLEFYYGEMPPERSQELKERLINDWTLQEKLEVIKEAAQRLEKSLESPRVESIHFIMEYAAAHSSATI